MHQFKIPRIWRGAPIVAIPKPEMPLGNWKSYHPIYLLCVPSRSLRDLSMLTLNQSSTHYSSRNKQVFNMEGRLYIRSPCWHRTLRKVFPLRRLELCLPISRQPKISWHSMALFFNISAAVEPSANVCVAHGTLCNGPNVCPTFCNQPVRQWYCYNCIELWDEIRPANFRFFPVEPLAATHGTLRFHGISVEKHCCMAS